MGDDAAMNPELIINHKFPETTYTYSERDAALYALGIGACAKDALDDKDLKYVYHEDGQQSIQVFPTFAALFSIGLTSQLKHLPGFMFDPRLLLHGQQYIEIYKPLPSNCKATILEVEVLSYEKETGEPLCMNRTTVYLRGAGGFSKSSEPYSFSKYPRDQTSSKPPRTRPFVVHEECTQPSQALLYRLSGDYNPLHSDPMVAEVAGAIIKTICNGDASLVKAISGRFLLHVYPGETLITEIVLYQTKVKERNRVVLAGFVDLNSIRSSSL
ncbi:Enoyl-CoA hydratase 2 [Cynara cardunculus var. scolymus]|uniref:Enoyl-CoA hydratase 2 n=1 Tax=Cynara cardunculus var. scolymus TaxID=59895 RepID=A0A103YEP5_CYNCS|nr:Enoyl-CoA hydratase 2 [Cynara cardunculus var. scolymus]